MANPPMPVFLWPAPDHWREGSLLASAASRDQDARRGVEVSLHHGALPQASSVSLAAMLLGRLTSPTRAAQRAELQLRLQDALNAMDAIDREILTLRHFEELNNSETAEVLGISKKAASSRYIRALKRLKDAPGRHAGFLRPLNPLASRSFASRTRDFRERPQPQHRPRPVRIARRGIRRAAAVRRAALRSPSTRASHPELAEEIRDLFPALVMIERLKPAAEEPIRDVGDEGAAPTRRIPTALRASGRLPHPPRGRPGRHGGRLRGRAGIDGPPCRAQDPPLERPARPTADRAVPARGPARRDDCTTATSCRSTAWASTTACTTTRCSSSRATAWTRSSTTSAGSAAPSKLRRQRTRKSRIPARRPAGSAHGPRPTRS